MCWHRLRLRVHMFACRRAALSNKRAVAQAARRQGGGRRVCPVCRQVCPGGGLLAGQSSYSGGRQSKRSFFEKKNQKDSYSHECALREIPRRQDRRSVASSLQKSRPCLPTVFTAALCLTACLRMENLRRTAIRLPGTRATYCRRTCGPAALPCQSATVQSGARSHRLDTQVSRGNGRARIHHRVRGPRANAAKHTGHPWKRGAVICDLAGAGAGTRGGLLRPSGSL